jgi:diacylglycerol kinase (ATP)
MTPPPAELRVLLAFNPRSGRGRGVRAAELFASALDGREVRGQRVRVQKVAVGPGVDLGPALADSHVLAIAGGDGSVHHTALAAIASAVPIYHIPCGNENLLAREFRMDAQPETLARALERWTVRRVDVADFSAGEARGSFLLMCSLGPDASIIRRLAAVRTRAVGHWAYLRPMLSELARPCYARVSVRVDGERIVDHEPGIVLVANSRQYALRIDPAARASISDGLLDVVFLPCSSRARVVAWGVRARLRRHQRHADVLYRQGKQIEISTESTPVPFQLDGECPAAEEGMLRGSMSMHIRPGVLQVLMPCH